MFTLQTLPEAAGASAETPHSDKFSPFLQMCSHAVNQKWIRFLSDQQSYLNYAHFYAKHREALSQPLTCICCCFFLRPETIPKQLHPTKNNFLQWKFHREDAYCITQSWYSSIFLCFSDIGAKKWARKKWGFYSPSKFRAYDLLIKHYIEVTMKSIQKSSEKSCTEFNGERIFLYVLWRNCKQMWQKKKEGSTKLVCSKNCREWKWTWKHSEHMNEKINAQFLLPAI